MNRNKKILALLLSLGIIGIYLCTAVLGVWAKSPHVVDDGNLISAEVEAELESRMEEISEKYQMDVVLVTTDSLYGKTAEAYADDYFDENGYGYGASYDGILFLISMEDRDWAISTTGRGIRAFTDAGQQYMMEQMLPDLRRNDFESAFKTYANLCEKFMKKAAEGNPYDTGNLPKEPLKAWHYLLAIAIGLLGGGIVTGGLTRELHSVRMQGQADFYMKSPIRVSRNNIIHLYDTVTKIRKPDPPKSGGGSSIHSGSSGRSHGGSHGKF